MIPPSFSIKLFSSPFRRFNGTRSLQKPAIKSVSRERRLPCDEGNQLSEAVISHGLVRPACKVSDSAHGIMQ